MSARAGERSLLDHAVAAALSASAICRDAGDHVGLHAFAAEPLLDVAPRLGAKQQMLLAHAMAGLETRYEEPDYERSAAQLLRLHRRRGIVMLFTSAIDAASSIDLLQACRRISSRHTLLCVVLNDGVVREVAERPPLDADDAARAAVAMRLLDERAALIRQLRSAASIVVDVPAAAITGPLLHAYLRIKRAGSGARLPAQVK